MVIKIHSNKIIILIILYFFIVQNVIAGDEDSYVDMVGQNNREINITPENASRYGIRVYMIGDVLKTDFKIKIANNWNGSKYIGHTVLVGMDDSYFRYSGFGCKMGNKGAFFLVSVLNNKMDSTVLKLDYLMSKNDLVKNKITSLDIDLKAFMTLKEKEPDRYVEHWKYGVGPSNDKLQRLLTFKSEKECAQFGLF